MAAFTSLLRDYARGTTILRASRLVWRAFKATNLGRPRSAAQLAGPLGRERGVRWATNERSRTKPITLGRALLFRRPSTGRCYERPRQLRLRMAWVNLSLRRGV
jgi:hypothetical protein